MEDELKQMIQEYVESHNVCTIAITDGNRPTANTMYYVSRGLHIYLESDPQSQKVHILKANPQISLTIDEDYRDWREIKGIQMFGRVNFLNERHLPKLLEAFTRKFPHIKDLGGIPKHHVFMEVIPEVIYFMDFTKNFGHKSVYYPKENSYNQISW
jgi:nitroimidazol reductase NimA-like FMN-containing flavoprotein (pyridoxamine 5'-phosphate oxidase superfamily)